MSDDLHQFFETYLEALDAGDAALFIGAGLSRASGYVDWKGLLRSVAAEIGLDVDRESDLIAVAQYHVNSKGNRARLNQRILREFTKDAHLTDNHKQIASLPLHTVWTTNYDSLLEEAFREIQKRPDVKSTQSNLSQSVPNRDVTIYKMHGDISQPQDAVLTKDDYETYLSNRGLFIEKLQGDLVDKTFLFLGFSFSDPNIDYVLGRLRVFLGQNPREHFCVMRRPAISGRKTAKAVAEFEYEKIKFDLRVADLRRYGISPISIDDFSQITDLLSELNRRSHRRDIFVSGCAYDYAPLGEDRLEKLARHLGGEIIRQGYNLVSGFGTGIGSSVVMGALEELYELKKGRQEGRTLLRPFPQTDHATLTREQFNTKYRTDMLSQSGVVVFISGNKLDPVSRTAADAAGVQEEFEIARSLGKHPIPIGASGFVAEKLWKEVVDNIGLYYKVPSRVKPHFKVIGDKSNSNEKIVRAVFSIIEAVASEK